MQNRSVNFMAAVNTISTLDGLFKEVYGAGAVNLLPDFAILSRKIPFRPSERIGEGWAIPVKLQHEHGFTYGASGDGAFTLNASVAGKIAKAIVNSTQIVLKSQMDYESAFKAASGGKQAFQDASQAMVENMMESFAKRQELAFLYGGVGLGKVDSITSVGAGAEDIVLTDATWAAGIWVGMVNCPLDAYDGSTKKNANADIIITAVDVASKQISVSGNVTDLAAVAAGQDLFFKGAYGKEANGIDKLLTNSGSLYGIDAATYELWRSTSYNVSGSISMDKVQEAASQAVALGLKEDVMCLMSPKNWTVLNNELMALRSLDSSYKADNFKNGAEGIEYHGVSGKVEIVAHPFVKDGEAFILPVKRCKRVGSTDITFRRPGNPNSFYREIDGSAGFELRAYSDQQLFNEAPGMSVKLTGIT